MQKQLQLLAITIGIMSLYDVGIVAQRPSYAGGRPSGGYSQKDKYHPAIINGVNNRFGANGNATASNVTSLPFGASQRPPMGSAPISPEPAYIPLPTKAPALENRFGAAGGDVNSNVSTVGQVVRPLDARGDQLLIDQLSRLPEDRRPFWFLNYQAIETQRNSSSPQTGPAVAQRGSFMGLRRNL